MSSLLDRANVDIKIAEQILRDNESSQNSLFLDQAAYHVQQGLEKLLKFQIQRMGLEYKKTHHLVGLISQVEQAGFSTFSALKENASEISSWEAMVRYDEDFHVPLTDVQYAILIYKDLVNLVLNWEP